MRIVPMVIWGVISTVACAPTTPPVAPTAKRDPLTAAEMQSIITGAARLERQCLKAEAETGLYVIRVIVAPNGRVQSATPRAASPRVSDPASYSGVAHYIDAGAQAENGVTRCYARAFSKLRFRAFDGPPVGFDHPVVVEKTPPSEGDSSTRACDADEDCVFRAAPPCLRACDDCVHGWRRAVNREVMEGWQKKWAKKRWRKKYCIKRPSLPCKPCERPLRGERALCIDGQCTVR